MSHYDVFEEIESNLVQSKFTGTTGEDVSAGGGVPSSSGYCNQYDVMDEHEGKADAAVEAAPIPAAPAAPQAVVPPAPAAAHAVDPLYVAWMNQDPGAAPTLLPLDTALRVRVFAWTSDMLPKLTDELRQMIRETDPSKSVALHCAAAYGLDEEIVQSLLDAGHEPNKLDLTGSIFNHRSRYVGGMLPCENWRPTPLELATYQGYTGIRDRLLAAGGIDTFQPWQVETYASIRQQFVEMQTTQGAYMTSISHVDLRLLTVGKLIGAGSFGAVYEADYPLIRSKAAGCVVKVQRIPQDGQQRAALWREIAMMNSNDQMFWQPPFVKGIPHRSKMLPTFIGMAVHAGSLLFMLMRRRNETLLRCIEHGPSFMLRQSTEARMPGGLPQSAVTSIVSDLAQHLSEFHWQPTPLVHGDIKADNALVRYDADPATDAAWTVKTMLADFGLMRIESQRAGRLIVCSAIAAPEVRTGMFTWQADMFSFGLLIVHVLVGCQPPRLLYHAVDTGFLLRFQDNADSILSEVRPVVEAAAPEGLQAIMDCCSALLRVPPHFRILVHHLIRGSPSDRVPVAQVCSFVDLWKHVSDVVFAPGRLILSADKKVHLCPDDSVHVTGPKIATSLLQIDVAKASAADDEHAVETLVLPASLEVETLASAGSWHLLHPSVGASVLRIQPPLAQWCLWVQE